MYKLIWSAALLAASTAAGAQSLHETHERVTSPGKTSSHFRPIGHQPSPAVCHPEPSKAIGCLVIARARADAAEKLAATKPIGTDVALAQGAPENAN